MSKIEGNFYQHLNKEDLDLSDVSYIRFNIDNEKYIDVQFKNGELHINGSSAINITLAGGSNCINVSIKE